MIVVLLVLLVVVVVLSVGVITGSGDSVEVSIFGSHHDYSAATVFLMGLVAGLLTLLLLGLLGAAIRRARRKRKEHQQLEKRRDEIDQERAKLDEKLGERLDDPPDVPQSRFDPAP